MKALRYLLVALAAAAAGFVAGQTARPGLTTSATQRIGSFVADRADLDARRRVLAEYPELVGAIGRHGGFGGKFSRHIATNIFSRNHEKAVADARRLTETLKMAPRTWLVRMPIVNATVFETDAGLVLVDTGTGPTGRALAEELARVTDAPLDTVIITHGHVDHAYGLASILEAGYRPRQIIAQENIVERYRRYIRLRGSIAGYMSQPAEQMPSSEKDLVWPTRTFRDRLELNIGGESFILVHHPAETDDQLYVWVPGRGVLASADYYQGFLPNAGNGKRVERDVEGWARALREMAALKPGLVLPGHGAAMTDPQQAAHRFRLLAEALESITEQTIAGLNAGLRKDQVPATVRLPGHLAGEPTLAEQYVSVADISKMVVKRYTGWWDDIPSHWTPAPLEEEAAELTALAGGSSHVAERARALLTTDIRLASHLADWAYLADPDDPVAQRLAMEVYRARALDDGSHTQETLAYIDHMAAVRQRQLRSAH